MERFSSMHDLRLRGGKYFLPGISIDCVIFGFNDGRLKVLLLKIENLNGWGLPGGFVFNEENLDDAACRILTERTGLKNIFLQQFYTFGSADRCKNNITKIVFENTETKFSRSNWLLKRFITIGYYALVNFGTVNPTFDIFSDECEWFDITCLPPMAMDHPEIVIKGLKTLQLDLANKPVGYNLLPEKFTMAELQKLYECVLGKPLDRRNFQRKINSYNILIRLKERRKGAPHKAPFLYRFDKRKYKKALSEGFQLPW